ncbi:glycogen debranching protein GlgX [Shewanella inventionis]|uniref:glycogen debranching protein GlgX n=1 Tax=Shewanella inventionis TaxID=1738770 RepID=UPI001CC101BB|nr:glycogen debranching protein GlgX [Shewanella inventionis]UAL41888.1 glycogen debranching protein GlgX [Shewanella inventionis]
MEMTSGYPYPLGATLDNNGVNFSLFSANATKVVLCLFDPGGQVEVAQYVMRENTRQIWHCHLKGAKAGLLYGYRVFGPYQPELGHRFNHHKLLLDPYAKKLVGKVIQHPALYGYDVTDKNQDLSFDVQDSAAYMPKCQVVNCDFSVEIPIAPLAKPLNKSVLFETHVKGFTKLHPQISPTKQGTFAGLASQVVIDYLQNLGITCVELLPVHGFFDEPFLTEKKLNNYWGYNSITFMAPHNAYIADKTGDIAEFRHMVSRLHQAGIEVILDVVFNHTAEGNHLGPTYSFRGIDNASYYRLLPNDKRFNINDTGCGNTFNLNHPQVLMLVMDSLRYWVEVMGVDGFRFDLASCLGREVYGFDPGSGFFDAITQDPILCKVKLIAEPWDIGPGGYQLGNYPVAFSEWNDRYRDAMRRFWRGDSGLLPEFAKRFHGSSDFFEHNGRGPSASINFITSHDGFTLHDLVSYRDRHNLVNGEDNRDGHQENCSDNYGVEGETDDAEINAIRDRQKRNLLTCLLLSQGVPMLLAGDESGQSQQGNNNAYCQDNPIGWFNWDNIDWALVNFTAQLITLRKRFPMLCHQAFIHKPEALFDNGLAWFNRQGEAMTKSHWCEHHTRTLSVIVTGNLGHADIGAVPESTEALLLMINADSQSHTFTLPQFAHLRHWHCLLHTQASEPEVDASQQLVLMDRSLMLFHTEFTKE